jgi:hypothetical protein
MADHAQRDAGSNDGISHSGVFSTAILVGRSSAIQHLDDNILTL